MAKIVLFVDAMEPQEYGTGWIETERGLVESGHPKVTPKVTSEVYTGVSPTANGMCAAHSMKGQFSDRPRQPMIQEKLERAGYRVASLWMPYSHQQQLQGQLYISESANGMDVGQHQLAHMCMTLPTAGEMFGENINKDLAFNTRKEDIYIRTATVLNLIELADLDVVFMGIRSPDQYTHFQWHEEYRTRLLEEIAVQVHRMEVNHDILWWSDHGSQEKTKTFRVNKWLMENGYLDIEMDMDFNKRVRQYMRDNSPQPQQPEMENTLSINGPGVTMKDSSQAICMDPYDSSIDIIGDDVDVDQLVSDLRDTGYYKSVGLTEDIWGEGRFRSEAPDIVTLREDGVLVTGNIHPEPIGMGFLRTGVHSAYGAWGTTDESFTRDGDVTPQELHDVIWEFVTGETDIGDQVMQEVDMMKQQMEQMMSDNPTADGEDFSSNL